MPPHSSNRVFCGIDSGGTSTRALLADDAGRIISSATAGAASYSSNPPETIQNELSEAIKKACINVRIEPNQLTSIYVGLGGVLSDYDKEHVVDLIHRAGIDVPNIWIENDTRNALAGGLAGAPGMVLISGTGAVCYGRNEEGSEWKSGGWGHYFDDLGSGYYIGRQALAYMVQALDGRIPRTELTERLYTELGISELNEIIQIVYQQQFGRARIAGYTPLVFDYYRRDDPTSRRILEESTDELFRMIKAVAVRLKLETGQLTMTGGVVNVDSPLWQMIQRRLQSDLPGISLVKPIFNPLVGSVLLALKNTGLSLDEVRIDNLKYSLGKRVNEIEEYTAIPDAG